MSTSTMPMSSSSGVFGSTFWEGLWRSSGLVFVAMFVAAEVLFAYVPSVSASNDALVGYYEGGRTQILIAAILSGNATLFLLWFAAALRTTLNAAGQGGWGAAATASSAVFGGLSILLTAISAALAYSIAGSQNYQVASGLHDFSWALLALMSLPRAMLIMSAAFGLWRAKFISNGLFAVGVLFVLLGVLGSFAWVSGSPLSLDGEFARYVSPALLPVWIVVVSFVLLRRPVTKTGW